MVGVDGCSSVEGGAGPAAFNIVNVVLGCDPVLLSSTGFSSEAIFGIVETQLFPAGGNDGFGWAVCIPAYSVCSLLSTWSTRFG